MNNKLPVEQIFNLTDLNTQSYLKDYLNESLLEPIQEFLNRPQKGLRTQLVVKASSWTHQEINLETLHQVSNIVEMIHSGSLIIDDIQDESVERRSKPCLHKCLGLSRALNAGNWLYFWALKNIELLPIQPERQNIMIREVHDCMFEGHIGQALDIGKSIEDIPRQEVFNLCYQAMKYKTGSLTALALSFGIIAGQGSKEQAKALHVVGQDYGILLQMYDDLRNCKMSSDASSDPKKLEDLINRRPGFMWAFLAKKMQLSAWEQFKQAITHLPDTAELYVWMDRYDFHNNALTFIKEYEEQFFNRISELDISMDNDLIKKDLSKLRDKLMESYRES